MWTTGNQKTLPTEDFNARLREVKGTISEHQAKILLAQYFRHNLGVCFEMLTGIQLLPVQELMLKTLFLADFAIIVAGRGLGKSFLIKVFSLLYPIFNPGQGMCLISANFRGSRRILEDAEKTVKARSAALCQQCFSNPLKRANDMYKWILDNGSEVFALPLSGGEGLRGTRAQVVCVDEGLLINKEIQDSIIRPFLTARPNIQEEMRIRQEEDILIDQGLITEADRISFPKNKYLIFSSASYDFEYLHDIYESYIDNAINPNRELDDDPGKYVAMRFSYKVMEELPNHGILDMNIINSAAKDGGDNTEYFRREYEALFSSSSDGYFNVRRMHECTVQDGHEPTIQLRGDPDYEYILSIDPSYSAAKSSDFFAMTVFLISKIEKKIIQVHTYAKAGGNIKDHFAYLSYLLCYFNFVMITIDDSGNEFIKGFNESTIAKNLNLKLAFLEVNMDKEGHEEYQEALRSLKQQYNKENKTIVYGQKFNSSSIRKMNEHLKNQIEAKKVWFASRMDADEKNVTKYKDLIPKFELKNKHDKTFDVLDFIDNQNYLIKETKNQTALIEVRATALGTLQFDLPQNLRRSKDINRARRDNYTTLLMGCTAATHYFNMMFAPRVKKTEMADPIILR